MAKKQEITSKTTAAAPTRVANPRVAKAAAPRVSSAKHSKSVAPETIPAVPAIPENRHEAISKIAYGYWIARGYRGGNPHEDWIRAEQAYLSKQ